MFHSQFQSISDLHIANTTQGNAQPLPRLAFRPRGRFHDDLLSINCVVTFLLLAYFVALAVNKIKNISSPRVQGWQFVTSARTNQTKSNIISSFLPTSCSSSQQNDMPVPWEALIPFGLLTAMFGTAGTLFSWSTQAQNKGKPARYNIDKWDEMMMQRDLRLTGHKRGQSSNPVAPSGFETNSVWFTEPTA